VEGGAGKGGRGETLLLHTEFISGWGEVRRMGGLGGWLEALLLHIEYIILIYKLSAGTGSSRMRFQPSAQKTRSWNYLEVLESERWGPLQTFLQLIYKCKVPSELYWKLKSPAVLQDLSYLATSSFAAVI
jgi:hypothetical protein